MMKRIDISDGDRADSSDFFTGMVKEWVRWVLVNSQCQLLTPERWVRETIPE
jgi:hypothetical protein